MRTIVSLIVVTGAIAALQGFTDLQRLGGGALPQRHNLVFLRCFHAALPGSLSISIYQG